MGQTIEKIAVAKGHKISFIADKEGFEIADLHDSDVAIEFTRPEVARDNILKCNKAGVPVVVGTTGWYDDYTEIAGQIEENNGALFTATNFSIGVNLFFALNQKLAQLMDPFEDYSVEMEEIHHTQKLDAPSGTAITLAEGIITELDRKKDWISLSKGNEPASSTLDLKIVSKRIDDVPGTHSVTYGSDIDKIEIVHTAHNRKGFAMGAVLAAEWLKGKTGLFTMKDMLSI